MIKPLSAYSEIIPCFPRFFLPSFLMATLLACVPAVGDDAPPIQEKSPAAAESALPQFAPQNMEVELWQLYLDAGGDINAKDQLGRYPILMITDRNIPHHVKICEFLLERGINVNREDVDGMTPLYRMIIYGNTALAEKILACGADVNAVTKWGESSLMAAARLWEHDLCVKLAEHGAKTDAVDEFGETALFHAAREGNVQTCAWLLEKGLDVNAKSFKGRTPLVMAVMENETEAVRFLLEKGACVPTPEDERDLILGEAIKKTLVQQAAERGNLELCKLLVKHGARFLDEAEDKEKLLHAAVRSGSVEMCRYVMNFNPNTNVRDEKQNMPLHYAALAADYDLCVLLLSAGADVDGGEKNMLQRPLLLLFRKAIMQKKTTENLPAFRIYDLLLGTEADVQWGRGLEKTDIKDSPGFKYFAIRLGSFPENQTPAPLLLAAYAGEMETCKKLLKDRADVNAKDVDGETALHYAVRGNKPEVCELLLKSGVDVEARGLWGGTAVHYAAMCGCPEIIKMLAEHGANLEAGDTQPGESALHWAVRASQGAAVVALVKAGINPAGNEYVTDSPFALALRAKKETYCVFLAGNRYDLNVEMEKTPLRKMLVGMRLVARQLEILRKCGLDFNRQDADGDTMLHFAARYCEPDAVAEVLAQGAEAGVKNKAGETAVDILQKRKLTRKERTLFGLALNAAL